MGSRPVLSSTAAQLFVADVKAACDFFAGRLGFTIDFTYGEPPSYGQVRRDQARLALRHVGEPVFVGDIRAREELLSAAITVDTRAEIDALFREFQSAGVPFHQPLEDASWDARNFIVRDPDGNLILFSGPA